MKTILFHIFLLGMFCLFLFFPIITLNGAAAGLLLWYKVLLPSLLPFIILTSVIIKTHAFSLISKTLGGLIGKLFSVSKDASIAIIIGFLCGYPMGAKVINDLNETHLISENEAQYLLSFCNNTSPMFLISFFILQILEDKAMLIPVLLSLYLSPIIMSCFTRRYYHIHIPNSKNLNTKINISHNEYSENILNQKFSFQLLDEVIMESIRLIMKIGGYVMLFSIFINLITTLTYTYIPCIKYFVPLLEITNGLEIYKSLDNIEVLYYCMIFLVSFGGLCSIGQTQCVLQSNKIKISHYFIQKIITAIIAVIISILYMGFYS